MEELSGWWLQLLMRPALDAVLVRRCCLLPLLPQPAVLGSA